ncbi:uncharacterized protein EV422DRAFT_520146 [Fimicolochytrium jonesii]|uniref:uncharacterized protein n=1 Tax=Fimicolochytrium jonesii TaxID=1396493 RepID=UPI0022FDD3C0|nr:uncharacterized protein EV422DRAFT_520146 [Fimicolochytrium jonesii]KAI8824450.1 hypothetical protein EV422DRAFT_520146 [Fimicolochytrium jonesii]
MTRGSASWTSISGAKKTKKPVNPEWIRATKMPDFLPPDPAPEVCGGCHELLDRERYSSSQLKWKEKRRCKKCIAEYVGSWAEFECTLRQQEEQAQAERKERAAQRLRAAQGRQQPLLQTQGQAGPSGSTTRAPSEQPLRTERVFPNQRSVEQPRNAIPVALPAWTPKNQDRIAANSTETRAQSPRFAQSASGVARKPTPPVPTRGATPDVNNRSNGGSARREPQIAVTQTNAMESQKAPAPKGSQPVKDAVKDVTTALAKLEVAAKSVTPPSKVATAAEVRQFTTLYCQRTLFTVDPLISMQKRKLVMNAAEQSGVGILARIGSKPFIVIEGTAEDTCKFVMSIPNLKPRSLERENFQAATPNGWRRLVDYSGMEESSNDMSEEKPLHLEIRTTDELIDRMKSFGVHHLYESYIKKKELFGS